MAKYRDYTDDDVIKACKEVKSMSGLLKKLNLKAAGGNYSNMKRTLQKINADCSHWTGQAWSKDQRLKDWSEYTKSANMKTHLIKERGHECETCGSKEWLDHEVPLEVHHKDGDRTNNHKDNLKLNCPNCHALTKNWRGRKNNRSPKTLVE